MSNKVKRDTNADLMKGVLKLVKGTAGTMKRKA